MIMDINYSFTAIHDLAMDMYNSISVIVDIHIVIMDFQIQSWITAIEIMEMYQCTLVSNNYILIYITLHNCNI